MRKIFSAPEMLRLLKAATILSIGGLAAGCSSDVLRFNDGFYTGAVPQQTGAAPAAGYGQPNYNPDIDRSTTGSVATQTVQRTTLPRPSDASSPVPQPTNVVGANSAPLAAPQTAAATYNAPAYTPPAGVSSETTASIPPASASTAPAAAAGKNGWSTAGATQVTIGENETLYNLSRRYGVPVESIMQANGISDAKTVHVGQRILIPTYVYSRNVGVSAPDKNPSVAKASATAGSRLPTAAPTPASRPGAQVATLQKPQEPAPARQQAISDGGQYTVVAGDTLSAISRRTGASISSIKRVNSMTSDTVRLGQTLIIPGLSSQSVAQAAVKPVDPIKTSSVEKTPVRKVDVAGYTPPKQSASTESGSIQKIETQETAKAPEATGVSTMRWPVQGRVISAFGSNNGGKPNDGIDISAPKGTPIKAAENGVVIYAGDGLKELGKTILVRHSDGVVTVYGHVSAIDVKRGQEVKRGQQIASSGMSGAAKQPQLHFEVRKNSKPVNPATYLQ